MTGTWPFINPSGGASVSRQFGWLLLRYCQYCGQLPIKAVLNALAEEALLNVISTPSVMVLDNNTAFIHVGDQVPIISEQSTGLNVNDRVTQSVIYKDTGVQLEVTPSVNAGGLVTMDVKQSVTNVRRPQRGMQRTRHFLSEPS